MNRKTVIWAVLFALGLFLVLFRLALSRYL